MADISKPNWHQADEANTDPSPLGLPPNSPANEVYSTYRAMMGAVKRWWDRTNITGTSSGTAAAYALAYEVSPVTLNVGEWYGFKVHAANTGAATLNINGIGSKSILRNDGSALLAGDLQAGGAAMVQYDGTAFRLYGTTGANATFSGNVTAATMNATTFTASTVSATTLTGNGAAVSNVDAIKLGGQLPAYYQRALTDTNILEIGGTDIGDKPIVIDMHTSNGTDYNARLVRDTGVNGTLELIQTGTGAINIKGGSALQRDGNTIWHSGNLPAASKQDALTGVQTLELGADNPGTISLDFHAVAGTDFDARISRGAGANADITITQTGTGNFNFVGGTKLQRAGMEVWHAGTFAPASKRDVAVISLAGSADLNGITTTGYYTQMIGAPLASNYPVGNGGLLIVNNTGGTVSQIYLPTTGTPDIYVRAYNGTVWFAWKKVNTSTQTISTANPSGGVSGDVWYKV